MAYNYKKGKDKNSYRENAIFVILLVNVVREQVSLACLLATIADAFQN